MSTAATLALEEAIFCPHCGYDLRTLETTGCPECGGEVDMAELRKCQIPWVYRVERGRMHTLLKTAWQVTTKTKHFCYEISRPVELKEALRFRWIVVWVLYFILLAAAIALKLTYQGDWEDIVEQYGRPLVWSVVGVYAVMLWVFLYVWTGVHTYWFHPRHLPVEHQNRAVVLSYYACGPLVFLPLVACLLGTGIVLMNIDTSPYMDIGGVLILVSIVLGGVLLAAYLSACIHLANRTAGRSMTAVLLMLGSLPLMWVLLLGVLLFIIPAGISYCGLMIYTLI